MKLQTAHRNVTKVVFLCLFFLIKKTAFKTWVVDGVQYQFQCYKDDYSNDIAEFKKKNKTKTISLLKMSPEAGPEIQANRQY